MKQTLKTILEAVKYKIDEVVANLPIATDDEVIKMMIQEDTLPAVTDSDGSILTDENGNILLW